MMKLPDINELITKLQSDLANQPPGTTDYQLKAEMLNTLQSDKTPTPELITKLIDKLGGLENALNTLFPPANKHLDLLIEGQFVHLCESQHIHVQIPNSDKPPTPATIQSIHISSDKQLIVQIGPNTHAQQTN